MAPYEVSLRKFFNIYQKIMTKYVVFIAIFDVFMLFYAIFLYNLMFLCQFRYYFGPKNGQFCQCRTKFSKNGKCRTIFFKNGKCRTTSCLPFAALVWSCDLPSEENKFIFHKNDITCKFQKSYKPRKYHCIFQTKTKKYI